MDIVKWSDSPALFIVNALSTSSVEVLRVVLDEERKSAETVVPDEMLSLAIGRKGQNVRLASKITGWTISVIPSSQDAENRAKENERLLNLFMNKLDVDEMIAHLLISEGYSSIEEIAEVETAELSGIEGFDAELAEELKNRANSVVAKELEEFRKLCVEKDVNQELADLKGVRPAVLYMLVNAGIKCLDDIGDLSTDELLEITKGNLSKMEAEQLIMGIRQTWFDKAEEN